MIELRDHLGGLIHVSSMLLVSTIKAEVEVAHEEIEISDSVWFNHFFLVEETDVFENTLRHTHSLIDCVLA